MDLIGTGAIVGVVLAASIAGAIALAWSVLCLVLGSMARGTASRAESQPST